MCENAFAFFGFLVFEGYLKEYQHIFKEFGGFSGSNLSTAIVKYAYSMHQVCMQYVQQQINIMSSHRPV